jgi:hypothetical protein
VQGREAHVAVYAPGMLSRVFSMAGVLVIALAVSSCTSPRPRAGGPEPQRPEEAPRPAGTSTRMQLRLHHGIGIHGYEYSDLLPMLQGLDPAQAVLNFSEDDIDEYRVDAERPGKAVFELTRAASDRMRSLVRPGESLQDVCGEGPFTISLDGRMVYGGLCYFVGGAAALRHPVLHVEEVDGRVELRVGDVQGRWAGFMAGDEEAQRRVSPPELTTLFEASGKLRPLR